MFSLPYLDRLAGVLRSHYFISTILPSSYVLATSSRPSYLHLTFSLLHRPPCLRLAFSLLHLSCLSFVLCSPYFVSAILSSSYVLVASLTILPSSCVLTIPPRPSCLRLTFSLLHLGRLTFILCSRYFVSAILPSSYVLITSSTTLPSSCVLTTSPRPSFLHPMFSLLRLGHLVLILHCLRFTISPRHLAFILYSHYFISAVLPSSYVLATYLRCLAYVLATSSRPSCLRLVFLLLHLNCLAFFLHSHYFISTVLSSSSFCHSIYIQLLACFVSTT